MNARRRVGRRSIGGPETFSTAASRAHEAFGEFQSFLEADLRDRASDNIAAGDEALALHLAEGHFLNEDAAEIERYARAELAEASADLVERAGAFGAASPAELGPTADTDDRVVPGHSFKSTAALQHAQAGDKPHLIRVETRAGPRTAATGG